jgi:glutamate carboxypeptidase
VTEVQEYLSGHLDDILGDIRQFVEFESPSDDKPRVDAFAEFVAGYADRMTGGSSEILTQRTMGNHVRLELGDTAASAPVLLVGHFDTVWPTGTLNRMPFSVDAETVRGPGVFDMKTGLVQGFWAIHALRELGHAVPPLVFVLNSDEELGSPTSRRLIESEARRAHASMILEPSFHGALKTARKGVGIFEIHITGRAAHAGSEPWEGVSAIEEAARITLDLHAQSGRDREPTINVGLVQGGTRVNVVAAQARLEVDLRAGTAHEAERLTELILGLKPHREGVTLQVTGGMNRPPLERTERVTELFHHARGLASELGYELTEAAVGGGSDGNFCAAVNPAVLDGLGAVGDGAHALNEHIAIAHIVPRTALLARLLETVGEV